MGQLSQSDYERIDKWQSRTSLTYSGQDAQVGDTVIVKNANDARDMHTRGLIHPLVRSKSAMPQYNTKEDKDAYNATNKAYIKQVGDSSWYEIRREGETLEKVNGKANAQEKLNEYNA